VSGILTDEQRDTLLIRLDERTARADIALFGSDGAGPGAGLVSRMAVIEERVPHKWESKAIRVTIPTAILALIGAFAKDYLKF